MTRFRFRVDRSASLLAAAALVLTPSLLSATTANKAVNKNTDAADLPETVTYSEHVATVFNQHCVTCHRPNDVAPMSLLDYKSARPWAKSIRTAVVNRDMPPWDANPAHGVFANDISLSDREVALIQKWVDQGAKQGDPALTPPTPEMHPAGSWKMGREPDYVVELASVDVPADGPDLFVTQIYGATVPEGKWIQAIELLPGNTDVLHHVVTYLGPFGMNDDDDDDVESAGVASTVFLNDKAKRPTRMTEAPRIGGVWVAGSPPTVFPEGYGHTVSADEIISLNMHYHPSGNAGSDRSKLGIYYGEGEIERVITTSFAADAGLYIDAGDADHREEAAYLFANDSKILSLLPHMHNRGKSMRYTLERPDGSTEVLLDVPQYDYDWQNIYRFAEPVDAPAGSIVHVEAHWDNSENNPGNPDPTIDVPWGDGTNNEMLVAFIDFVDAENMKPRAPRINQQVERLLKDYDPEASYMVGMEGMGFGGKWGLVLPTADQPTGEFILMMGQLVFTNTIHEPIVVGNKTILNTGIITSGGGTRMPLAMVVETDEQGGLTGQVFFNRELTAADVEAGLQGGRGLTGQSLAAQRTGAAVGAR